MGRIRMTNRDILNRELINQLFVRLFNQIWILKPIYGRTWSGRFKFIRTAYYRCNQFAFKSHDVNNCFSGDLTNGTITTAIKSSKLRIRKNVVKMIMIDALFV